MQSYLKCMMGNSLAEHSSQEMGNITQKYDGVVLEYIGDAMMIVFGAPKDVENHQIKAVQ